MFLIGVPSAAVSSMIGPLIMRSAPPHMIGRVSGVLQPATQVASVLATATAAWLASTVLRDLDATIAGVHFGPIDTIFLAGGLLVLASGVWAVRVLRTEPAPAAGSPDPERHP
jgi:MFS family permease